ncbi:MAG: DUF4149 domain-containing protein [Rhodospirillales bacterium]|nr:DUF4149 domain-containing protein [Rhodospirillales bacterium]
MAEAGALVAAAHLAGGTLTAAVFGGMLFFAFVYAPLVFTKLPAAQAGAFIRDVFPVYYKAMGGTAIAAGAFLLPRGEAILMIAVGAVFFAAMLMLMPRINAARDASLAGKGGATAPAAKTFSRLHRISVVINFVQMLAVLAVLVRLLGRA